MGIVNNISIDKFPKQGEFLDKRVIVCFNFDATKTIQGTIVRDDEEEPGRLIITLDDDRYILSTECQYKFVK